MPKSTTKRRAVTKRTTSKSKRAKSRAGKRTRQATKSSAAAPRLRTKRERPSVQDEEAAFNEALIASGDAARPDEDGKLPPGATPEIVEDQAGNVRVVRRRFSVT